MAKYLDSTGLSAVWNKIKQLFAGVPTKTSDLENDSDFVTTTEVDNRFEELIGAAPAALDTLEEIAEKLSDNDDVHAALVNSIAERATKTELQEATTATALLDKIKTVDGPDSGLDATYASKLIVKQLTNEDLNNLKDVNLTYYYAAGSNTVTNKPSYVDSFGLQVARIAAGLMCQILTSSTAILYIRIWSGTSWSDWVQLATVNSNVASSNKLTTKKLTNENLNDLVDTFSNYWSTSPNTITNKPEGVSAFNLIVSRRDNASYVNQIIISAVDGAIYTRHKSNTWSAWKKLLSEDDINVVTLTQAEYDALTTKNANTLYCIPE